MKRLFMIAVGLCCAIGVAQANGISASSAGHVHNISSVPPAPRAVLYDQMDNQGDNSTSSQDFETANDAYDDQVAG